MIELINTSVPSGLLAGTHGFCTVAMTQNTPAPLRERLEALSAYKHLVSSNNEQYRTGNPIAWSHLVLPQGEHVFSCVRASTFDYTGRTNRLAHHWCLSSAEMPSGLNPADAILYGNHREKLSATWNGEPRYLNPEDPSMFRSIPSRSDVRPTTWNALFGVDNGPAWAAGFAALLGNSLKAGRPIVVSSSPSVDPDGGVALNLFAEVIALLPEKQRGLVTFCTYPSSLPDWMTCHLRCLQSNDPSLPSLTAGMPWIDLVAKEVKNSGKLPKNLDLVHLATFGKPKVPAPEIRMAPGGKGTMVPSSVEGQRTVSFHSSPRVSTPSGTAYVPPVRKPKDKTVPIVAGLVGCTILLIAAIFLVDSSGSSSGDDAGVSDFTVTNSIPEEESLEQIRARQKEEAAKEKQRKDEEEKARRVAEENKAKEMGDKDDAPKMDENPKVTVQDEKPSIPENLPQSLVARILASSCVRVEGGIPPAEKMKSKKEAFWIAREGASSRIAEERVEIIQVGGISSYRKDPKQGLVILAVEEKSEYVLYWQWYTPQKSAIFSSSCTTVNLRDICFGTDAEYLKLLGLFNENGKYDVDFYETTKDNEIRRWFRYENVEASFSVNDVLAHLKQKATADLRGEVNKLSQENEVEQKKYQDAEKELNSKKKELADETSKKTKIATDLENYRKGHAKPSKNEKEAVEKQIRDFRKCIDETTQKINEIQRELNSLKQTVTLKKQLAEKKAKEFNSKNDQLEKMLNDGNLKNRVIRAPAEVVPAFARD